LRKLAKCNYYDYDNIWLIIKKSTLSRLNWKNKMHTNVQIIYKKVKNITLKVKPNLEVILTVPTNTKTNEVQTILDKRNNWIVKQIEYFKTLNLHPKSELVSGEKFEYLGCNYKLKISESNIEFAKLDGGYLHVGVKDKSNYQKKWTVIEAWYKEKASYYFNLMIKKYMPLVNKSVNKISIRKMKTRWGSCNPRKSYINLNLELIKKHPSAIEYVVLHELTHLIHYHHDKNFYDFLTIHMPDWKQRKAQLYISSR
jgi:predicted metal-dependent hydrolase